MSKISSTSSFSSESSDNESTASSKSKLEAKWLLEDSDFLDTICQQSKNMEEFPGLLYDYFEANEKGTFLLGWSIEKEVQLSKDVDLLSNHETIAHRLIIHHLYGELGNKFLYGTLGGTFNHIIEMSAKEEQDKSSDEESVPSKQTLTWIIKCLDDHFADMIERGAYECPILIRESFSHLRRVLKEKSFENPLDLTAEAFIVNFIIPVIADPTEYAFFIEKTPKISPRARKCFEWTSQILESVMTEKINSNMFGEHSEMVKNFIPVCKEKVIKFVDLMTDSKSIKMAKAVVEAASAGISVEKKVQAAQALTHFLNTRNIEQNIEPVVNYKIRFDQLLELYKAKDWKAVKFSKGEVVAYTKKVEGSPFISFKTVMAVLADFDVAKEWLSSPEKFFVADPQVADMEVLKRYSENHVDIRFRSKPAWPVAGREWVLSFRNKLVNENLFCTLGYSVPYPDLPIKKKYIRADMFINAHIIERDPENPNCFIYYYIYHMDVKGSMPAWMLSGAVDVNMKIVRKYSKHMKMLTEQSKKNTN